MDKKAFVFRTDDNNKEFIWNEINNGRLRQGWGLVEVYDDKEKYIEEYLKKYKNEGRKDAEERYQILKVMKGIELGDILVVPKMPDDDKFVILLANGRYRFDLKNPDPGGNFFKDKVLPDFGHIIEVDKKQIKVFDKSNAEHIFDKLKPYRKAVILIKNESFKNDIWTLWKDTHMNFSQKVKEFNNFQSDKLLEVLFALKTKPFLILAGVSGTGKTQIARIIAGVMSRVN